MGNHLFMIFAVLDVSLAVNLCINCSFFTFITDKTDVYVSYQLNFFSNRHCCRIHLMLYCCYMEKNYILRKFPKESIDKSPSLEQLTGPQINRALMRLYVVPADAAYRSNPPSSSVSTTRAGIVQRGMVVWHRALNWQSSCRK